MQGVLDVFLQTFTLVPLVLAVYISYEVMKITDLTVEGSFVLGAAVYARLIIEAINPVLTFFIAILAGLMAGIVVGCIQRHDKIDKILKISAEKKKGGGGSYLAPLQQREIDKEFGQGTYSKFLAA